MIGAEITAPWPAIGWAVLSTAAVLAAVITYTRIAGLRSFSKMSSFDFAVTIAIGSTMASTAMSGSSLVIGIAALGTFYVLQATIAQLRRHTGFDAVVDNDPVVLMVGSTFLSENLDKTRVSESDVKAKLREANVGNYDDLQAVILESTGDISVLHGGDHLDPDIFSDVRDAHHLRAAGE